VSADRASPKLAVVGHVEWVQFARVRRIPAAGEIASAEEVFEEPAGGGGVAAVQLARIAGAVLLITALGHDEYADRSIERLSELGVRVHAARRPAPTRRAVTLLDRSGERAITTLGERLQPSGHDEQLPWGLLGQMDGVYFTAGDAAALAAARSARTLVATPRAGDALTGEVALDALVLSACDELELRLAQSAAGGASLVVRTEGSRGGTYTRRDGRSGCWAASDPPAAIADSYGCGDSFAAGLTYGLAAGLDLDRALALAARCGAVCLTGNGPYERQLRGQELELL
jgi:ribokinase